MAGVKVDVSGIPALKAAFTSLQKNLERELTAAVAVEAETVVSDARSNVRVNTGDLRDSIGAEIDGMSASVSPYAGVVPSRDEAIKANVNEFGRPVDPGQPFMVPAAERSRTRWPNRAADAVRRGAKA
jgi:hypothetical protein